MAFQLLCQLHKRTCLLAFSIQEKPELRPILERTTVLWSLLEEHYNVIQRTIVVKIDN